MLGSEEQQQRRIEDRLKIAFVCGFAWEPKGTVRARAFPLAAELVNRGYEVTLFLTPYDNPAESGKKVKFEGVRIVNIDVGEKPGLRDAPVIVKRLCAAIRQYSPDVVHVFKPKGYAGAACTWLLLGRFRRLALDCDDWEGWGGWNDVKEYPWIVKEYIDRQEKWLLRRSPVVTTASRALQQRAIEVRGSSRDIYYVPNCGPSKESFRHLENALTLTSEEAKRAFGLDQQPVILYSGHFEASNEILFFCRSVATPALRFDATVVVVGEGPGIPQMKELFKQREGLKSCFFPRLPYDQFSRLIAASDLAAFPYPDSPIYQAKCSARIIDYMIMGKAVVTTAVGQNLDYIINGESGILTAPGNEVSFSRAIESLLRNQTLRVQLGRNARERIKKKFSWSAEPLESCLTAYERLSESAFRWWD